MWRLLKCLWDVYVLIACRINICRIYYCRGQDDCNELFKCPSSTSQKVDPIDQFFVSALIISINSSSSSVQFSYSQILKIVEIPRITQNWILFKWVKGRNYYLPLKNVCVNFIWIFPLFWLTHAEAIDIIAKTQISISDTFFFILLQFFLFFLLYSPNGRVEKSFSRTEKAIRDVHDEMKQEWNVYF